MSVEEGKRIFLKRARPNPLFQKWVQELYEEAREKNSPFETMLKEALASLSKYPLPLESGGECAILKGFDKRLCLFLDKRLEAYRTLKIDTKADSCDVKILTTSQKSEQNSNSSSTLPKLISNNPIISQEKRKCKVKNKPYKPAFRSGTYAILLALLDHYTHSNKQKIGKNELINIAQKYCEDSFTRHKPGTYYTAWSSMRTLITKSLVKKTGNNYSLTEGGHDMAKQLILGTENIPSVNDVIFKDSSYETVNRDKDLILDEILENNSKSSRSKEVDKDFQIVTRSEELIEMLPGSFDIILLIDKNETGGVSKKNDPTVSQFNKFPDLKHEYRSLKVGDFTWIARHKTNNHELVLPYIVERKRMDDLGASIKDGRFHEQKFRLRKCGLNHVIYMVENYGSNKHVGLPIQTLMQALANTRVQDGFNVQVTDSLSHSARFLAMMTLRLTFQFKDKILKGHHKEAKGEILATFDFFNKASLKNKPLSVTDTFIKLLLQLKGVSVEKALAITNVYKTPQSLMKAYHSQSGGNGELLLVNLRCGEVSRNVGPSVSKSVYQLFTFKDFT